MHVLVLAGGEAAEHPISLRSAATVVRALAAGPHRVTVVGIRRDGVWILGDLGPLLDAARTSIVELNGDSEVSGVPVVLAWNGHDTRLVRQDGKPLDLPALDVCFPVLHGPLGEDGTVQGTLALSHLPFVGAHTTAAALAMDKLAMKTLCAGAGIAQVEHVDATARPDADIAAEVESKFGYPCFVKPANQGSSVGVSKAGSREELAKGLAEARLHDRRVLVERAVDAREIELAVLGAAPCKISPPGEVLPAEGFYDFNSKYVDDTAGLIAPTEVEESALATMHEIAQRAWELIDGRGMARIDFFLERKTGEVLLNEINTIPGFTEISMYPRLWRAAGVETPELVEQLLRLALEE
ncbi:MAG: D-alanine-D-alanine ligase [Hyphomicrobiaceae bacterium]|jgi:D-alanine-D-alanine ligase